MFLPPQYPAMFVLAVTVAVYGYTQPYISLPANILEVFLSLDIIVLLLLKNTQQVVDQLQTYSSQSYCQEAFNATCQCDGSIEGVTSLTWILLPLYYIPLVTAIVVSIGWIAVLVR